MIKPDILPKGRILAAYFSKRRAGRIVFLLVLAVLLGKAHATSHYSVANGLWTNAAIWSQQVVPNWGTVDTVYVNHDVEIPGNGHIYVAADIVIGTHASLYTYNQTHLLPQSRWSIYGTFTLQNNLWMDGGWLDIYYGGYAMVKNKVDNEIIATGGINLYCGVICFQSWKGLPPYGEDIILYQMPESNKWCYGCGNPLGISLISFDATCTGRDILVRWTTENEDNNDHFRIEKSRDLEQWALVGTVPGQLHSSGFKEYLLADPHPWPGTAYYRLSQADHDGTLTCYDGHWIRVVICRAEIPLFTVSPNPVMNELSLCYHTTEPGHFTLIDHSGKVLIRSECQPGNQVIDFSFLKAGMYFLQTAGHKPVKVIKH